mgnify:CR=1 FL=1
MPNYPNMYAPSYRGQGMLNQRQMDQKLGTYTGSMYSYTGNLVYGDSMSSLTSYTHQQQNLAAMKKRETDRGHWERYRGYGRKSHFATASEQHRVQTQSSERSSKS